MKFTRIKGEDKPQNVIRLPRLGKIRLGIKKTAASGKEYPAEVDYFVVPDEIKKKFGDKPKSLPVMIAVENEEMFLRQYYAVYGGNQRLKCQGDGETAERRDDKGKITQMACPSPKECAFAKEFKCSARIDVMLVLPDINCGGVYQLSSGSVNTDIDLRSGIEMARYLFNRVAWVPMMITREERKIADPETGKMQTHWPVRLYPQATVAEVNQIRSDEKRIIERQDRFLLPEPVIEGDFVSEPVPQEERETEANSVQAMIDAIGEASSATELAKLFKSNVGAINALSNVDKAKIIDAKHRREEELTQRKSA